MNKSILSLATMMAVAPNIDAANGSAQQNTAQQNKRPNIIFFLVDDMGCRTLRCLSGLKRPTTTRCTRRQIWSDSPREV